MKILVFIMATTYKALVPWNIDSVVFSLLLCQNKARSLDFFHKFRPINYSLFA